MEYQAAKVPRFYGEPELQKALFRCDACLNTFYMNGTEDVRHWYDCPLCQTGAKARFEGWLNNGRIKRLVERLVCDPTCNHARGLECVCPCNGANHGVGVTLTYREIIDAGNAPVVRDINRAEAKRTAEEYLAARAALKATVADIAEAKGRGQWLARPDFDKWLAVEKTLARARKLRTHKKRMEVLTQRTGGN